MENRVQVFGSAGGFNNLNHNRALFVTRMRFFTYYSDRNFMAIPNRAAGFRTRAHFKSWQKSIRLVLGRTLKESIIAIFHSFIGS